MGIIRTVLPTPESPSVIKRMNVSFTKRLLALLRKYSNTTIDRSLTTFSGGDFK